MKHKETLSTNKGNKEFYITNLKQEDIRDILLLEQKSRTPELQASEGIVNTRLQNWHIIMWIKKWNNQRRNFMDKINQKKTVLNFRTVLQIIWKK